MSCIHDLRYVWIGASLHKRGMIDAMHGGTVQRAISCHKMDAYDMQYDKCHDTSA